MAMSKMIMLGALFVCAMVEMSFGGAATQPMDAEGVAAEKGNPVATTRPEDSARQLFTTLWAVEVAAGRCDYKGLTLALENAPEGLARQILYRDYEHQVKMSTRSDFVRARPGNESRKVAAELVEQLRAAWSARVPTMQPGQGINGMLSMLLEGMPDYVAYESDPAIAERNARESLFLPMVAQEFGAQMDADVFSGIADFLSRRLLNVMAKESDRPTGGSDAAPMRAEQAAAFYKWILANRTYFYFHPISRKFGLDAAAREHHQSSAEYRAKVPWPANEGPNDPKVSKPIRED
ncbi:MAG: hypothetical protein PHU85_15440 [Phycisphaerae bacterium]|nr:hypothetical protein [Phycisphaerae bacterium]